MANKIVDAHIGKRALTAIFDLFFAFLLGVLIYSISSGIFAAHPDTISYREQITSMQVESGLYYKDSEGEICYYDNLVSYDLYETKLVYYYTEFLGAEARGEYQESHDIYWYNVFVLGQDDELHRFSESELSKRSKLATNNGKSVWEYVKENEAIKYDVLAIPRLSLYLNGNREYGLSETGKALTLHYYYNPDELNAYFVAAGDLYSRPYYLDLVTEYENRSTVYPLMLAIPNAAMVFYLVLPLVFRDGQTLGKKIMKLAVIRQDEYASTRPQIVLRQLPTILAVSIWFIFLPWNYAAMIALGLLILSYGLSIFTPHHRAIHDYIAFTRVVDDANSIYYKKGDPENDISEENPPVEKPKPEEQPPLGDDKK